MAMKLPVAIAEYFEADRKGDAAAVANCFTADAVVRDEGHTYTGRVAIQEWKASSSAKYSYAVEPFAIADDGGRTVVTGHVVGDFPGSPVDLRYLFTLTDEGVSGLEIEL
jgi:ketosteroid isomerase-like protein